MAEYEPIPHIQDILDNLPIGAGVYQMIDPNGTIIYVGKAKNLRSRVRSYFQAGNQDPKVLNIRADAADIQFILTGDELKALITEAELIRVHQPRYNVLLKDDKRYPYIRVTTGDAFPTVEMTRRVDRQDGHRYFGPFTSAGGVRESLDVLRKAFPYLTCDREITGKDPRPCLYYDIKLCGGPCIGAETQEEYWENINGIMRVLSGHAQDVLDDLREQMQHAAESLDFERAALLRDRLKVVAQISARQRLVADVEADQDVIAFAQEGSDAVVQMFLIRNGRLVGNEYFPLDGAEGETIEEIIESFLMQFYESATDIPREVILPHEVTEAQIIEQWLRDKRGGRKVKLTVPQRGNKRELVQLAAQTATEKLAILRAQWESDTVKQETALREIQAALNLPNPPNRIECYDISTTQGTAIVASRVVFVQGVPRKAEYRRFNIRTVTHEGSDDYQSMREALTRRFRRYVDLTENPTGARSGQKGSRRDLALAAGSADRGRRQGAAGRGVRGAAGVRPDGSRAGVRAGEAVRGNLPAGARAARSCCRAAARGCSCSSVCATRRTASPSRVTAAAGAKPDSPASLSRCRASVRSGARHCSGHSTRILRRSARRRSRN